MICYDVYVINRSAETLRVRVQTGANQADGRVVTTRQDGVVIDPEPELLTIHLT
ncbi:MAG TPA: hypothetical protein V6C72_01070 [Chroococcales cyanobacterium]